MAFGWSRFPDEPPSSLGRWALRWRWALVGASVTAVAGGIVLWLWVWPRLERRADDRALNRAQAYLAQRDYRRAQLTLEQVVQVSPRNFGARRRLADFYLQSGSTRALQVWREVAALEPANDANWLGWAAAALHFGAIDEGRQALAHVSDAGRGLADYHRYAAGLALAVGDKATLLRELKALARIDPASHRLQFNALAVGLLSPDAAEAESARQQMIELARGGPMQIRATLALMRLAEARNPHTQFAALTAALLTAAAPAAPGAGALVAHMVRQPAPEAVDVVALGQWLNAHGFARESAAWIDGLDPAVAADPAVRRVRADNAAALKDWDRLAALLRAGAWGPMPPEAVDLAFAARRQRIAADGGNPGRTWDGALDQSEKSRPALNALLRLAREFGWREQEERTLLRIVAGNPREVPAWTALVTAAVARGDTAKCLEYYRSWVRAMPDYKPARAQLVLLSVIAGRFDPEARTQADSADLQSEPAVVAALSLVRQRQGVADATDSLAALPRSALAPARTALAAGAAFAFAGMRSRSEALLALVDGAALLPEEAALLTAATQRNAAGEASATGKAP